MLKMIKDKGGYIPKKRGFIPVLFSSRNWFI